MKNIDNNLLISSKRNNQNKHQSNQNELKTELAFRTGDIIYVYGDMDEDGFYIGEANGMRGLVPSNFLADAGPVDATAATASAAATTTTANVRHVSRCKGGGAEQSIGNWFIK